MSSKNPTITNKQTTIWLNVTTLSKWSRPPVGIIRVEYEFVKYLQNQSNIKCRYFIYDKTNDEYYEKDSSDIKNFYVFGTPVPTAEAIKSNINSILRLIYFKTKSKVIGSLSNTNNVFFDEVYRTLKYIYHNYFLIPKYYAKLRLTVLIKAIEHKFTKPRIKKQYKVCFNMNDKIITLGLDWDNLDLPNLFELKQKIGFKVFGFCYDLIPVLYPHLCVHDVANGFSKYFVDLAWTADHIFAISNNSKKDITHFLKKNGAPVPKISTVRLGDSIIDTSINNKQYKSQNPTFNKVINDKYILFVSTIEKRKNHDTIYKAYRLLIENNVKNLPKLVFVGMIGWGVNDFIKTLEQDPIIKDKIYIFSNVSDIELNVLYKNCLFTIFPSLYEGWGLPVAESLSHGKFCLASNSSSIIEIAGELIDYIQPWDVIGWKNAILKLSITSSLIKNKELNIASQYRLTSWSDTFNTIIKIIELN